MLISFRCPFHSFVIGAAATGVAVYLYTNFPQKKKHPALLSAMPSEIVQLSIYENELRVATEVAVEAGDNILAALNNPKKVDSKGAIDFVTETDKNNEILIFNALRKNFPSHVLIGEESCSDNKAIPPLTKEPTWIVDPVDGTTNFVHNFPFSCVSIGFVVNGIATIGVVYSPSTKELFQGIKGHGAFLNGQQIHVSSIKTIKDAIIMTEFGYQRDPKKVDIMMSCLRGVIDQGAHAIRQMGSGALDLCYVASGRLDAVYAGVAGEGWSPWDYAAGSLLVTEAGGIMATVDGAEPFQIHGRSVLATGTTELCMEIQSTLQKAMLK